jgi:hypothetical protein
MLKIRFISVTQRLKGKSYTVLAKSLTSQDIWARLNSAAKQEVLETAVKDIVRAMDSESDSIVNQEFLISAAKLIATVSQV